MPSETTTRIEWMDAGKGLAILLVVLLHAQEYLAQVGWDSGYWANANHLATGLRMPLFFAVSGMLATSWLARPWRTLLTGKVLFLGWVYAVWVPVALAASALTWHTVTGGWLPWWHWPAALAAAVVAPSSILWFLWALAIYFPATKALARFGRGRVLAVAVSVSTVWFSGLVPADNFGVHGAIRYYAFFAAGAFYRDVLARCAERSAGSWMVSVLVLDTWLCAAALSFMAGMGRTLVVGMVVQVLGLFAGVTVAVRLARVGVLRWLGQRTLPVYVAHGPLLAAWAWILAAVRYPTHGPVVAVLVVSVCVVVSALVLWRSFGQVPMYAPPGARLRAVAASRRGSRVLSGILRVQPD